jgi:acetolactate synthase-1/2/3 large subunit
LIERAAAALRGAERPLVLVGGGLHLSGAYDELAAFVDATGIPVGSTISGKGAINEQHPLAIGLFGRFSRFANDLVKRADVLLVVGCKLGEIATSRWTLIQPGTRLVHVDIDPSELGKIYRAEVGVWGDAKLALADLHAALREDLPSMAARKERQLAEVRAARAAWLETAEPRYRSDESPIHMARVLREMQETLPPESIIVADGGFAAHWSALLYDVPASGRTYIANRGHAAIGYGLPGAIGAKLAAPAAPVVALCGDNGFAMAVAELETAKRVGAPVIALVMNNAALGYVKALQHGLYQDRFISVDFEDVDYGAVARAFGCYGRRVAEPGELRGALDEALQCGLPAVLDILITTDPAQMLPSVDARTVQAVGTRS